MRGPSSPGHPNVGAAHVGKSSWRAVCAFMTVSFAQEYAAAKGSVSVANEG